MNETSRLGMDSRGVSDAVGYILLLGVVFISITSVVILAGPLITEQQEEEYVSNTVHAFEIFDKNIKSIERERSPSRATEMKYQGGTLFEDSSLFLQVNVTHDGTTTSDVMASTPVTYRKGGSAIHYEMGSVIREDHGNNVMRTDPPFTFTDDQVRMSMVTTTVTDDPLQLGRSGKVVLLSQEQGTTTRSFVQGDNPDDVEVELTIESPRYELWRDYFKSQGLTVDSVDHSRNSVQLSFTTKEFMLRETLVRVESQN